ncbi:branched-chain amino acid transporter permease [Nocardiopsis kunsanensis]|uniref:branched-chain amino acid transporter permease n=1 Tax=Nocardiopsis kunsanensis TaxID=141693 RepID=UPI00034A37FB|nr:AzlD domain-containing protein [Nocardiopsis kunsanensis]
MSETHSAIAAVLVAAAVTWGLRALPFAALATMRTVDTVDYFSTRMPAGVMIILAVYSLSDLPLPQPQSLVPLTALAVTVGLHLWRGNALLSILGGTTVHVVLSSTVPTP